MKFCQKKYWTKIFFLTKFRFWTKNFVKKILVEKPDVVKNNFTSKI